MQTKVTIGTTVSAFAEILVEIPKGVSQADAVKIIKQAKDEAESSGKVVYKPDWSTQECFRVVAVSDQAIQEMTLNIILDDKPGVAHAADKTETLGETVS